MTSSQSDMTPEEYRRRHPYCWRCGYMFSREPLVTCKCHAMEEAPRPQEGRSR